MRTNEINTNLIDGYLELLGGLSPEKKLELISKLSDLVKVDLTRKNSTFRKSFGALDTEKSAEEIISEIRSSRLSNRKIESF
jgi:hypothetical protein